MRHLKWFLTRHGMLVFCMLMVCITSAVWYWVPDYTTHLVFYYLMWAFFTPPALTFIFLMIGAGVNYALEKWPDNKALLWWRGIQFKWNTPFNEWFPWHWFKKKKP